MTPEGLAVIVIVILAILAGSGAVLFFHREAKANRRYKLRKAAQRWADGSLAGVSMDERVSAMSIDPMELDETEYEFFQKECIRALDFRASFIRSELRLDRMAEKLIEDEERIQTEIDKLQ